MSLTPAFVETVRARATRDASFRRGMLCAAVDYLLAGELAAGRSLLRDYINATIGFEQLSTATGIGEKALMRMVGPHGNPQTRFLVRVLAELQAAEGVHLRTTTQRLAARPARVSA